jgi:hypothetical protein
VFTEFIGDLKKALPDMETKKVVTIKKPVYSIYLYDYSTKMFLELPEKKGTGYTTIDKNVVQSVIAWLEAIDFGKG